MAVVWCEEYSVNDPDIDGQHQQLFKCFADPGEYVKSGVDDTYMRHFFTSLGVYTCLHFCFVKIFMQRRACPAAKNKEQHKELLAVYSQALQRSETEGVSEDLIQELHNYPKNWLIHNNSPHRHESEGLHQC